MWALVGLGFVAWFLLRRWETVNGLRHFTKHGRAAALQEMHARELTVSPLGTIAHPGAAEFVLTEPGGSGVTATDAIGLAESNGGVVILSETESDVGQTLIVVAPGGEGIATPGSGLAIFSVTPP